MNMASMLATKALRLAIVKLKKRNHNELKGCEVLVFV